MSQTFAQERERHRHFGASPPEQRYQPREQFRELRVRNPEEFKKQNSETFREQRQQRFRERNEEMRIRGAERAREADANRDGAISRGEAQRSMPHLSRHFDEIDANRDGVVTPDERRAFRERRMRERADRGRGDPRF